MAVSWLARFRNPVERLRLSWNLLIALVVFATPTHFFFVLNDQAGYVNGLRIDYLLPKLYLSVVLALGIISWWLYWYRPWKTWTWAQIKANRWQIVLLVGLVLAQLLAARPGISLWFVSQLSILLVAGYLMIRHSTLIYPKLWLIALSSTVMFQASIALWQWLYQRPLIGYWLLGEPSSFSQAGIATTSQGAEWVLPYATTAHPNVLGGFLAISTLSLLLYWLSSNSRTHIWKSLIWLSLIIGFAGLLLTQSSAALLGFSLGAGAALLSKIKLQWQPVTTIFSSNSIILSIFAVALVVAPVVVAHLTDPRDPSWYRRDHLNRVAVRMLQAEPIAGVGLNHFTIELEHYSEVREFVRFVQPAHNALLLWLAETGVLGVAAIIVLILWVRGKPTISPVMWGVLPLLALDHYMLTMPLGILLIAQLLVSQRLAKKSADESVGES